MRSLLTIFTLLVWLLPSLASASALKGVRGHKLLAQTGSRNLKKEKTCKKYKEPKVVKEKKEDPKAKATDPKAKAKSDPKANDPKMAAEKNKGGRSLQPEPKDAKEPKAVSEELECLEWETVETREDAGSGSTIMTDPTMTSTSGSTSSSEFDSINVDCEAIANDKAPTDTHSVSFSVNIDVLKDAESTLNNIYDAMEKELQQKVAPRIAGCSSARLLAESGSSKIVHVDFGEMEFDRKGCDSTLAQEAKELDGVCMASDVPVDVYFVGDFPENAIAKVEVAIEEHEWDVDGLLGTSEVAIVQTGSTLPGGDDGVNGGMIGGIVAAILACCCCGGAYAYKRSRGDGVVAKAELETDEESTDDEKNKVAVTQVEAKPVRRW